MSGVNMVILIGRLGKDPEVRYTPGGDAVANFSIATSQEWKDKESGEKKERTEWHRIVAWRKLGEICGEYLAKGKQVYIAGHLQTRSWEQDGVTRYTTEIVADQVQFLGDGRGQGDGEGRGGQGQQPGGRKKQAEPHQQQSTMEDDIPF